jgi:hypothetical protein
MKKIFFILSLLMLCCVSATFAQTRKTASVSARGGINGTFRLYHPQKFRKFYNEVKISSIGKGQLKIGVNLVYPKLDAAGIPMLLGTREIEGTATLRGNTATFTSEQFVSCSIMIKFLGDGVIAVLQESEPTDCGFGRKDVMTGNYRRISGAKPKFKDEMPETKVSAASAP